jgi:hypothetical protein
MGSTGRGGCAPANSQLAIGAPENAAHSFFTLERENYLAAPL